MLQKFKMFTFYVQEYAGSFPCSILHEISHWLVAIPFFTIGLIDFPKIRITRLYDIRIINEQGHTRSWSNMMSVYYSADERHAVILAGIVASSPIALTVLLFIYSPWWMYLYYISNISWLWVSTPDVIQMNAAWNYIFNKKLNLTVTNSGEY